MESNQTRTEKLPYVKPEAELLALRTHENIAAGRFDGSGDEFNGEDDAFD